MSDKQDNTRRDKQVPAEQLEQRGLVTDVVVPIVQAGVTGYVAGKVSQGKNPRPEKKDN
jgi:N-acetylmuramic acid 6-phosphate (MurNAc-6-P) etherase